MSASSSVLLLVCTTLHKAYLLAGFVCACPGWLLGWSSSQRGIAGDNVATYPVGTNSANMFMAAFGLPLALLAQPTNLPSCCALPCCAVLCATRDDHWRQLHRTWQPVFYADSVRACAPLMDSAAQRMLDRLDELAANGQPLDIWREVGNLTMSIVGTTAFG